MLYHCRFIWVIFQTPDGDRIIFIWEMYLNLFVPTLSFQATSLKGE